VTFVRGTVRLLHQVTMPLTQAPSSEEKYFFSAEYIPKI
jgi:hypothetical protein